MGNGGYDDQGGWNYTTGSIDLFIYLSDRQEFVKQSLILPHYQQEWKKEVLSWTSFFVPKMGQQVMYNKNINR